MIDIDAIRTRLASCVPDPPVRPVVSVTIFGWTGEDRNSELDLVIVLDAFPVDLGPLTAMTACFDGSAPTRVNVTWTILGSAEQDLRTPGHPMTDIAEHGVHVAGTPLASLVADPAPYDAAEVRRYGQEMSSRWVSRIRERAFLRTTGEYLALVLEGAANAALMHHRLGRIANKDEALSKRGARGLAELIADHNASEVEALIGEMRTRPDANFADAANTVQRLIDLMLEAASDPAAPGCTIG